MTEVAQIIMTHKTTSSIHRNSKKNRSWLKEVFFLSGQILIREETFKGRVITKADKKVGSKLSDMRGVFILFEKFERFKANC